MCHVKKNRLIAIKEVAGVCGLLMSLRPAMGDIVRFRTRSLLLLVAKTQQELGWGSKTKLDEMAVSELEFWAGSLVRLNGFPIRSEVGVVSMEQKCWVSDAGEFLAGGVEWTKAGRKEGSEFQVHLTKEEQKASSTEREMVGQRAGLRINAQRLAGCNVRWVCDNWATSIIHRVGV